MEKQLEQLLGMPVQIKPWNKKKLLPPYLEAGRNFDLVHIGNVAFLLVGIPLDGRFSIQQLAQQMGKLSQIAGMQVALSFSSLTYYQRQALIQRQIPFICLPGQVYLPFLGIILQDQALAAEKVVPDKLQAASQQVFLQLFYNRKHSSGISKSELAAQLGLTKTSITRAVDQLDALGLLRKRDAIRSPICLRTDIDLKSTIRHSLIDPVQKRIVVSRQSIPKGEGVLLAGESCLAEYSMLNAPRMAVYACCKKSEWVSGLTAIDPLWDNIINCVQLELWKYPPNLFAVDEKVDPVSLYCSLRSTPDERVEGELETMLETIEW